MAKQSAHEQTVARILGRWTWHHLETYDLTRPRAGVALAPLQVAEYAGSGRLSSRSRGFFVKDSLGEKHYVSCTPDDFFETEAECRADLENYVKCKIEEAEIEAGKWRKVLSMLETGRATPPGALLAVPAAWKPEEGVTRRWRTRAGLAVQDSKYNRLEGRPFKVVGPVPGPEYDLNEVGPMYKVEVQHDDGEWVCMDAFLDEIAVPEGEDA